MAASSPGSNLYPSEGKSRRLPLLTLIVEGGAVVLRHLFDQKFPPQTLKKDLQNPTMKSRIGMLIKRKVITKAQASKLNPIPDDPCSSTFDITLLTCLLRNICGLAKPWDPVWSGNPPPTDLRVEADITRLRNFRNELSHLPKLDMTESDFENKWKEIEYVLTRLGSAIPTLKTDIEELYSKSIDPVMERHFNEVIGQWRKQDTALANQLSEIEAFLDQQSKQLQALQVAVDDLTSATCAKSNNREESVPKGLQQDEEPIPASSGNRTSTSPTSKKNAGQTDKKKEEEPEELFGASPYSPAMSVLLETSEEFFKQNTPGEFVETEFYKSLKKEYSKPFKMSVLLYGKPGEGKTTMAVQLMRHAKETHSSKYCVKVNTSQEFIFAINSGNITAVLIDDIFGHGIVDYRLLGMWKGILEQLLRKAGNKNVYVVITSDEYVLNCAEIDISRSPLLCLSLIMVHTSSKSLSHNEKLGMLKSQIREYRRSLEDRFMEECVTKSMDDHHEHILTFGFPQCAKTFASNDKLFNMGPDFFSKPTNFLRSCLEDIYRDMKQFLPLAIMWALPGQRLKKETLAAIDMPSKSAEVHAIAKRFGFKLKGNMIRKLRRSLDSLNGFFTYNKFTGYYGFSNETVGDVVGQVLSRDFTDVVLEKCSYKFLLKYTTIDCAKNVDSYVYIDKHQFKMLGQRLLTLVFQPETFDTHFMNLIKRGYNYTRIFPTLQLDTSVFKHDAFMNSSFVGTFMRLLSEHQKQLLTRSPILTMTGFFLGHGIYIGSQRLFIPSYVLLLDREVLFRKLWQNGLFPAQRNNELELALLVAVHMQQTRSVDFMISLGLQVNDSHVYLAAENGNIAILKSLLNASMNENYIVKSRFNIAMNNNPLIIAVKRGHVEAVRCLVNHNVDLNSRNSKGFSAIDKAIMNIFPEYMYYSENKEARDIVRILLAGGASINEKAGKFKRTPLHTAADIGDVEVVQLLVKYGADTRAKDHRRQYPIHCALLQGYDDIAIFLLHHDPTLADLTLSYYSPKSAIRGMNLAHITCLKSFNEMVLVELHKTGVNLNRRDHYGRTPVYIAAWAGHTSAVEFLLNKVDITIPDKQGYTPLHAAVNRGYRYTARLLYSKVDINVQDKYGKTALHVACEKGHYGIVKDIIKLGKNIDIRMLTKKGESVFHILAIKYHHYPTSHMYYKRFNVWGNRFEKEWVEISDLLKAYDPKFAETAKYIKLKGQ